MAFGSDQIPSMMQDTLQGPVLGVASLSNADYHALRGFAFRATYSGTIAIGGAVWIRVTVGAKGLIVLRRSLMPDIAGSRYELYTGTSGFTPTATLTPFNVDRSLSNVATTSFAYGTTAPTTPGTLQDTPILIGAGDSAGSSGRPAGTLDRDDAYDYYPPGSVAYARIYNNSGIANYTVFRFLFAEVNV